MAVTTNADKLQFSRCALPLMNINLDGGIFGVLLGVGASIIMSKTLNWPTLISPISIVASVIFSVFVGVAFGYYPARKAAGLDPIEALRYE